MAKHHKGEQFHKISLSSYFSNFCSQTEKIAAIVNFRGKISKANISTIYYLIYQHFNNNKKTNEIKFYPHSEKQLVNKVCL